MISWLRTKLSSGGAQLLDQAEKAYAAGDLEQMRAACMALLRREPNQPRALFLMASAAADEKKIDEGLRWARLAQETAPHDAAPHYALGRIWEAAARYAAAETSYRRALQIDADNARIHNNLGVVLHMQGRFDEALDCYRRALEIDPAQPQANQNYALIALEPASQQRAIEGYVRHLAANPNDAAAFRNLGNLYNETGRADQALAALDRALALAPDDAGTHLARAGVLLLLARYEEGWKEYEWRWRLDLYNAPAKRFPNMWNGERLAGTVLMHGETGLGDMLQFVRYAPRVAERCEEVVLECQPALKHLFENQDLPARLVTQGDALPAFDAHVPIIRLPYLFATTLQTVPWSGPYLRPDPRRVAEWAQLLGPRRGARRIGLVWAGNPANMADRRRSMQLSQLAPLAGVAGVEFHSLQKGPPAAETAAGPEGLTLLDFTSRIRDFSDTAALVSVLDLVLTVDTSVAHLAGAMGVPVWVMLSWSADWRYHSGRNDNPWYPTMRLFRQPDLGNWSAVVQDVAAALREGCG